jgi:hypothetical protein
VLSLEGMLMGPHFLLSALDPVQIRIPHMGEEWGGGEERGVL